VDTMFIKYQIKTYINN